MGRKKPFFTLWKVTDGVGNTLKYYQTRDLAEIYATQQQVRIGHAYRLYSCVEKPNLAPDEQQWYLVVDSQPLKPAAS